MKIDSELTKHPIYSISVNGLDFLSISSVGSYQLSDSLLFTQSCSQSVWVPDDLTGKQ